MAITFSGGSKISGGITLVPPPPPPGSIQFNGTTDYLQLPGAGVLGAPDDFTFETFAYFTSNTFTNVGIIGNNTNNAWGRIYLDPSGLLHIYAGPATPNAFTTSAPSFTTNTWYHIACVRSGSSIVFYVNGVAQPTTVANGLGTFTFYSGYIGTYTGTPSFAGNLTNLRWVVGTAVYTSNFTVPTSPLAAISGTQLLLSVTNAASYIVDSSTNNFTLTATGTPSFSSLNPF